MNFIFLNSLIIKTLPKFPNFGKVLPKKTDKSIIGKSSLKKNSTIIFRHLSFILYNFVLKKPYFFLILTLVTWKMQPIFLTLFPF